jgi:hypothetical protein
MLADGVHVLIEFSGIEGFHSLSFPCSQNPSLWFLLCGCGFFHEDAEIFIKDNNIGRRNILRKDEFDFAVIQRKNSRPVFCLMLHVLAPEFAFIHIFILSKSPGVRGPATGGLV